MTEVAPEGARDDGGDSRILNGPVPVEPHAALWRYVTLPTLLSYLSNQLRLSSVKRLRQLDPYEGLPVWDHITQAAAFESEEYSQLFDYFRDRHLSKAQQDLMRVNAGFPGYNQRIIFEKWQELVASTRYCLCLFRSDHESMAMWRLYAPHGFAIQTSLRHLEHSLRRSPRDWRITGMAYLDKSREVLPDHVYRDSKLREGLRRPWILKSREYKYEQEIRLATVEPKALESLGIDNVNAEDWIQQIRISSELWPPDAEVLKALIIERCPPLAGRVFQSVATRPPTDESDHVCSELESDVRTEDAHKHWPDLLWKP